MKTLHASNQPDKDPARKDPAHKDPAHKNNPGEHREADKSRNQEDETVRKPR